ncbi:MAG: SRPBCC domain-containing protein [Ferruginibacter sp.]
MNNITNHTGDRSIGVTALLPASPALVWQVWTNPEDIARWWGPSGFTNIIHTMEVQPGGEWQLTMQGPDGKRYPNKSRFVEVIPLQKIVFDHFYPNYTATILLEPLANGTLLQWEMVFETAELFDTVVKVFKADEGLVQNIEKLEKYLQQIQHEKQ